MVLLKLIIFTLTFSELFVDLDAWSCPKGQRFDGSSCIECPKNTYQPEETRSKRCKPCRVCDEKSGSVVKEECMRERNTECQCRKGFVPWDSDSSTCKCDAGFGLVKGECKECQHGYFNTHINSPCQKWKECAAAGVRSAGTTTQDVTCNEGQTSNTSTTISPTSSTLTYLITNLTSPHPQGGNKTQTMITTTAATTTTTTMPALAHTKRQYPHSSITGNHIGMAIVMFGVVLLLGLTAVICKPHITACVEKGVTVQKNDSLCRRPVEESGDDSLSSLKLNAEEP